MDSPVARARTNATEIAPHLDLGAGFLTLFGEHEEETKDDRFSSFEVSLGDMFDRGSTRDDCRHGSDDADHDETDPLVTLRERYARGELSDETFERKLERLLETETYEWPESASSGRIGRGTNRSENSTAERVEL